MAETNARLPTLYIPHGGGPCFFMDDPHDLWGRMAQYLRGIGPSLGARPQAVLVVSGHWEEPVPTVTVGAHPPLLFDYYGFPEHTYRLAYPAPGSPDLARRVRALLGEASIASAEDGERGFDHGVFVPFLLLYPTADIPVVQLSLKDGLDPAEHLAIGRALAPLRGEGVLIVGSGMSYHNLRDMFRPTPASNAAAAAFDTWLAHVVEDQPAARERALRTWSAAPGARTSHPREEHLLPLMVAAGAAGADPGRRTYSELLLGKPISGFEFG